jgi:hypothetical protein
MRTTDPGRHRPALKVHMEVAELLRSVVLALRHW